MPTRKRPPTPPPTPSSVPTDAAALYAWCCETRAVLDTLIRAYEALYIPAHATTLAQLAALPQPWGTGSQPLGHVEAERQV